MIRGAVPVLDVVAFDEALAYFETALSFRLHFLSAEDGYAEFERDGTWLHLQRVSVQRTKRRSGIFFTVSSLERLYVEFAANGAFHQSFPRDLGDVTEHGPLDDDDGNRELLFMDPFGFLHRFRATTD